MQRHWSIALSVQPAWWRIAQTCPAKLLITLFWNLCNSLPFNFKSSTNVTAFSEHRDALNHCVSIQMTCLDQPGLPCIRFHSYFGDRICNSPIVRDFLHIIGSSSIFLRCRWNIGRYFYHIHCGWPLSIHSNQCQKQTRARQSESHQNDKIDNCHRNITYYTYCYFWYCSFTDNETSRKWNGPLGHPVHLLGRYWNLRDSRS